MAAGYLKAAAFQSKLLENIYVEILSSAYADYAGCQMLSDIIISKQPSIIGFSLYLWNVDRTLSLIERVKAELPDVPIIVGGPDVTKESKAILSNKNIDIAVFGEGEFSFVDILKFFSAGKPELKDILGIGYRKNNNFFLNNPRQRIMDINAIPSPYLLGYIKPEEHREMLLFTMKGCTLGCSYCTWTARGKLTAYNLKRLEQEMLLARKGERQITVSLIDSALNASPIFNDFCRLVEQINKDGLLKFNCFVQADLVNESTASLLKQCGFTSVEVGLQSANSEVLANVNRRVDIEKFLSGVRALKKEGLVVGVDVIVGLPGDSPASFDKTMKFLSDNDLNPMIFQLSISPASKLAKSTENSGTVWQSFPPYYVKKTKTFSKKELQQTFIRYREKYSDLDRIINLNYPAILLKQPTPTDFWKNPIQRIQKLEYPLRSIVFESYPNSEEMRKLGRTISYKVSNSLTILCAGEQNGAVGSSLKVLLEEIFNRNVHSHCLILLENQPHKIKRLLEKSLSSVRKTKTFLDNRDELYSKSLPKTHRRSINVFAVDGREKKNGKFYLKKLVVNSGFNEQSLKEELSGNSNCGFLVDFPFSLNMGIIRNCMDVLLSSGRTVFFRDWVMQRLWEQEYLRVTPAPQPVHYEILIDKNSSFFGKRLDETDLLWDSIYRWKILKKEYEELDLDKLVLEKAMASILKTKGV